MKPARLVRYFCLAVWVVVLVGGVLSFILHPAAFTAENIAAFLQRFHAAIWLLYLVMSALRGFTLLPSTPLVLAGTILFPDQPLTLLAVSLAGIALSSSMIYFFADLLGFHEYFASHKPELSHRIKSKLEHPLGCVFVGVWAFFPFVPTDLVCYLAGTTEMNYWKFISSVLIGEAVLCSFYIFFGGSLVNYFR